jgi:cold shock CspA family protein
MAKSQQSFNKSEKEKAKQKKRKDKEQRKAERKSNAGNGMDNMIAYVDENGMITSTPPDPSKKRKVIADNIQISIPKEEPSNDTEIIRTGIVTYFNEAKGFGFIKDSVSFQSVFTHINDHLDKIKVDNKVSFIVRKDKKGLTAIEVRLVK